MSNFTIAKRVADHRTAYKAGRATDPRIFNANLPKGREPEFGAEYLAEWDRQCLAERKVLFQTIA